MDETLTFQIMRFARFGLVHGDFNEFNTMVDDDEKVGGFNTMVDDLILGI